MAKDTFYFSHDYNTRSDSKIKKLISKFGHEGYGLFWCIIEDLYNNANALPTEYECIAFDLRSDEQTIKSIINDFDLFIIDNGFFGSLSVQNRLEERSKKSANARGSANKRWGNANALQSHCEGNAIKERKVKEIKKEKIKKEKNAHTQFLDLEKSLVVDKLKFEESEIFDRSVFRERFDKWSPKRRGYYYNRAISDSSEGKMYANWALILTSWNIKDNLKFDDDAKELKMTM